MGDINIEIEICMKSSGVLPKYRQSILTFRALALRQRVTENKYKKPSEFIYKIDNHVTENKPIPGDEQ